jgi:putative FmdB family regulatory protein
MNMNTTKIERKGNLLPAYEYLCDECACRFEMRQKMSDATIDRCPECGGHVKRLISGGAGAITKGASQVAERMCGNGACCGGGMCNRPVN